MKASIIGAKYPENSLKNFYNEIKKVLESNEVNVNFDYFSTSIDEDNKDIEKTYKKNKKLIRDCDFLVAEVTLFGSGIGYLIAEAISMHKPVLALYNTKIGDKPSTIIKASSVSRKLNFVEYSEKSELKKSIEKYLKEVKTKLDTKFILIIPAEIDRYLEWASKEKRMHKAQLVREAIDKIIEEDRDYQEYQNTL